MFLPHFDVFCDLLLNNVLMFYLAHIDFDMWFYILDTVSVDDESDARQHGIYLFYIITKSLFCF